MVTPLYLALEPVVPSVAESLAWLNINRDFWQTKVEEMEEQMNTCRGKYTLPEADEVSEDALKKAIQRIKARQTEMG